MNQSDNKNNGLQSDIPLAGGVNIVPPTTDVDDVQFESYNDDLSGDTTELSPKEHIKALRDKLRDSNALKLEYLDGWQRLKAEFVNYKKREEEGKANFLKFSREGVIVDLLPILESFHMAFSNKEAWEKVDPSWRTGVEYINTQLLQVLGAHGLEEVRPLGERFDSNIHTSVGTVITADPKLDHTIAEVIQLGYKLSGKLIRSPRVKIFVNE